MVTDMGNLVDVFTVIFTKTIGLVPEVASAIMGNEILLFGIALLFTGFVIGIFSRLLRNT